jgi:hypothetical protein
MDPYLERQRLWKGVHDSLIYRMLEDLQPRLQPRYIAVFEGRLLLQPLDQLADPGDFRSDYSDVSIREDVPASAVPSATAVLAPTAASDVAAPEWVAEPELRIWHTFLEIRDDANQEVVTVIELLSPWNKSPGQGQEEYRAKQRTVLLSDANLVEIDLLRGGAHTVAVRVGRCAASDYRICTHRIARPGGFEVHRFGVRDPLPRIGVPLKSEDPDVVLDLPAVFTRVYDTGLYHRLVDYTGPADPPLTEPDATWADDLLRKAGFR